MCKCLATQVACCCCSCALSMVLSVAFVLLIAVAIATVAVYFGVYTPENKDSELNTLANHFGDAVDKISDKIKNS